MRITIAFSGAAGAGVNTAGLMLGELLLKKGFFVLGDKEYESIIKGGNNLFNLYISDTGHYISSDIDLFFAFDQYAIDKNSTVYDIKETILIDKKDCHHQNTYALALAAATLGLDQTELEQIFKDKFDGTTLEQNLQDIEKGFASCRDVITARPLPVSKTPPSTPKTLTFGNEVLAQAAIHAGLKFYSAYPMTPSSSLIDVITKDPKVEFFQGEDEIAVAMAMLGARYAGARSMCGTSGGGFALMSESISFAGQAEIGGVYILAQRSGPSTGTPTFTEQADITYALCPTFGGIEPLVLCPSDYSNGALLMTKALERAETYQHPVIFLIDKQYAESHLSTDSAGVSWDVRKQKTIPGSEDYARYKLNENGISPATIPGTAEGEFIATSYEHDEHGATSEDPEIKKQMLLKRAQKIKTCIQTEFNDEFSGFEVINPNASNFFVTFGANTRAINPLLEDQSDRGMIVVTVMQPLDPRLSDFFTDNKESIQQLCFVEMNADGQFQQYITKECKLHGDWETKITNFRKYTSYPIFEEEIAEIM